MKDEQKTKRQLINELTKFRKRIAELEILQIDTKGTKAALKKNEERYRAIVEDQTELICRFKPDGILTFVNEAYCRYFGKKRNKLIGFSFLPLIPKEDQKSVLQNIKSLSREKPVMTHEHPVFMPNNKIGWQQWTNRAIYSKRGDLIEYQAVGRDITERKEIENALKARERELDIKTRNLEELNTALKVLMKKMEEDKIQREEKILVNIKELIKPYLEKIKKSELNKSQKTYIDIIESNLNEIISSFTLRLASKQLNLTPTEIQVANLIKQGKRSKEIAELINTSPRTIAFHREGIRKKLGLQNKKINLRSYLLSKFN